MNGSKGKDQLSAAAAAIVASFFRPHTRVSDDEIRECLELAVERLIQKGRIPASEVDLARISAKNTDLHKLADKIRRLANVDRPTIYRRKDLTRRQRNGKRHKLEIEAQGGYN